MDFPDDPDSVTPAWQALFLDDRSRTRLDVEVHRDDQWGRSGISQRGAVRSGVERVINPAGEDQERSFVFLLEHLFGQRTAGAFDLGGRQDLGRLPTET